jgi:hypothetical protein
MPRADAQFPSPQFFLPSLCPAKPSNPISGNKHLLFQSADFRQGPREQCRDVLNRENKEVASGDVLWVFEGYFAS